MVKGAVSGSYIDILVNSPCGGRNWYRYLGQVVENSSVVVAKKGAVVVAENRPFVHREELIVFC